MIINPRRLSMSFNVGQAGSLPPFWFRWGVGDQNDKGVLSLNGGRIFSPSRSNILRSAS